MGERIVWIWTIQAQYGINQNDQQIRDAATVILVRDPSSAPSILMGQRGSKAVFMPEKVVFPGGAVDPGDRDIQLAASVGAVCQARLCQESATTPDALAAAAVREVFEETGLALGARGGWTDAPQDWVDFAAKGLVPDASALRYFFRAITPPGRPRRFDARFFIADATALTGDLDDFSLASAELSHLRWVPLSEVRSLNLAFITRLVLAELDRHLPSLAAPEAVPMVRNDTMNRGVIWLR